MPSPSKTSLPSFYRSCLPPYTQPWSKPTIDQDLFCHPVKTIIEKMSTISLDFKYCMQFCTRLINFMQECKIENKELKAKLLYHRDCARSLVTDCNIPRFNAGF